MALTPNEIQKYRFNQKLRGYDPLEVDHFLALVAEEVARHLEEIERLGHENQRLRERAAAADDRERQLQDAILRGKKVSDEMIATSQREAQLLVKEAEVHADRLLQQAMERAGEIENRIHELRTRRKELVIKLRGSLELFSQIIDADDEEERASTTVQTLTRRRSG